MFIDSFIYYIYFLIKFTLCISILKMLIGDTCNITSVFFFKQLLKPYLLRYKKFIFKNYLLNNFYNFIII